MATTVETALGPIATTELGPTLMHEHIVTRSPGVHENWPHLFDRAGILAIAERKMADLYARTRVYRLNGLRALQAMASGTPGPAGIGVVLLFREHRKEISRYLGETTNNVAELTAVLVALRLVKRRDLPVRVHADSTYTIGVATGAMRAKKNTELVEEIRREARGFADLRYVKVSAHSGVEHNERADALARLAVKKRGPPL